MNRYEQLLNAQYTIVAALSVGREVDALFEGEHPDISPEIKEVAISLSLNGIFGIPYKGDA